MFYSIIRRSLSILCLLLWLWLQPFPYKTVSALAVSSLANSSVAIVKATNEWSEVHQAIVEAVKKARLSTEEFAANELDSWMMERMKQVDKRFLNWYFGFFHQKATQDGVPFAWLALKVDALNWLKAKDEKGLSPEQIIQKRMLEEFEQKFNTLVLNEEAIDDLKNRIEHIAQNYASVLSDQFESIKAKSHVPEQDWEKHMSHIAQLIYNTGTSESSLSPDSLTSLLTTRIIDAAGVAVATKLAIDVAAKMAPKFAIKGGTLILLETGAKFLDPLLIVGVLVWDAADHHTMVSKSRPELRKNIEDYLLLVKSNIYDAPDGSILAAIDEVEGQIVSLLTNATL